MKNKVQELYALEQLSAGTTVVHKLHPTVKLLTTLVFIITVVSFGRYDFGGLVPFIFYPVLLMSFGEITYPIMLKRFLVALPFIFFIGLSNIIFDRTQAFAFGGITFTYGAISFFTLLFRTYLCVMAVLILVAVTPLSELTRSMKALHIPRIFITLFEMTYRYIGVLWEEGYSMYMAYSLRSNGGNGPIKGIAIRDMGSFIGQLLLRSIDRAERVYNAMECRGYGQQGRWGTLCRFKKKDWAFGILVTVFCLFFRILGGLALCLH